MIKNSSTQYGAVAKVLHWVSAMLIITLIGVGLYMSELPKDDYKYMIYFWHKSFGFVTLFVVIARTLWRLKNVVPELPKGMPQWQIKADKINIVLLYVLMLAMPVSGVVMGLFGGRDLDIFHIFTIPNFGEFSIAHLAHCFHENAPVLLIICICVHIAAAIYHKVALKDGVLERMF